MTTMHKSIILGREAVIEVDGNRIVGLSLSAGCGRVIDIDAKDLTEPEVRMVRAVLAKVERTSSPR